MKRLFRMTVTIAAVVTACAFSPVSPASAHTDVCVGTGTATTAPLYYPGLHPGGPTTSTTGGFSLSLPAACVLTGALNAAGTLTGWCGQSYSLDLHVDGHKAAYVSAGSLAVVYPDDALSGESAVGVINMVERPRLGRTECLDGATTFTVTAAIVLLTP